MEKVGVARKRGKQRDGIRREDTEQAEELAQWEISLQKEHLRAMSEDRWSLLHRKCKCSKLHLSSEKVCGFQGFQELSEEH